jgi:hypothetical protein
MERKLWKSCDNKLYRHKHCGNCFWSVDNCSYKGKDDSSCPCKALQEDLGDKVKISSTCSNQSFVYDKVVMVGNEKIELFAS